MNKRLTFFLLSVLFLITNGFSQNIYFKNVNDSILPHFKDTANKIIIINGDSSLILKNKFSYALSFFPKMEYQNVKIKFCKSQKIVKIKHKKIK